MYDAVADLPLTVDAVALDRLERETPAFTRATTIVALSGAGETGRGEDVTYEPEHHDALRAHEAETAEGEVFDLAGEYTVAGFSTALDDTDLWPVDDPGRDDFRDYRRWAFEAAGLDLALRQNDTTLAAVLDRQFDPVRFRGRWCPIARWRRCSSRCRWPRTNSTSTRTGCTRWPSSAASNSASGRRSSSSS
jgi:hypothetical protein